MATEDGRAPCHLPRRQRRYVKKSRAGAAAIRAGADIATAAFVFSPVMRDDITIRDDARYDGAANALDGRHVSFPHTPYSLATRARCAYADFASGRAAATRGNGSLCRLRREMLGR